MALSAFDGVLRAMLNFVIRLLACLISPDRSVLSARTLDTLALTVWMRSWV